MLKLLVAIIVAVAFSAVLSAQTPTVDDKAAAVVKAALDALGGQAEVQSLGAIYVHGRGVEHRSAELQGYAPDEETTASHEIRLAVYTDGRRLANEYRTGRHDGTERWRRFIYTPSLRIVIDFIERDSFGSPVTPFALARTQTARSLPHTFLLELAAHPSGLKYDGTKAGKGGDEEVVSYTPEGSKIAIVLYFDRAQKLLRRYEYTADIPGLGPTRAEYAFEDYRADTRLKWFPAKYSITVGGKLFKQAAYDEIAAGTEKADQMLRVPDEYAGFTAAPRSVAEIAPGAFMVYGLGGYQPLFIEFKDYVVAIEAPASYTGVDDPVVESMRDTDTLSRDLIAIIKKTTNNKPIKYIVPTHFHGDHSGGIRAFADEGATVLTTGGNRTVFEKYLATRPGLTPKVEVFKDKLTLTDGTQTVDLMDVGKNPHTSENIVAYFPKANIMFQGDLFYFDGDPTFPTRSRTTVMPFFARWLAANKFAPKRIYGFHSPMFATMEHVDKILKLYPDRRAANDLR